MNLVFILYAFAVPGAPPLDCGVRKCELGRFPSRVLCEYAAYHSEEYHDKTIVLRCLKQELR